MKRFWTAVAVNPVAGGFEIALDGKPMRTPAKRPMILPTPALAAAVAAEWRAVAAEFDPKTLGLTRLANTALDRVAELKAEIIADMVGYAGTDLLCYRASEPEDLARRQTAAWHPVVDWVRQRYDVEVQVTTGLMPVLQSPVLAERVRAALMPLNAGEIAALQALTGGFGSVLLCLAVAEGRLSFDEAWAASRIDEEWEMEKWGADEEAVERSRAMAADLACAHQFLTLVRQPA